MAGKSGRSINNVPENPMKHIIFSWEGILVILFILVNIFCASFSEFYNLKSVLRQMPVYLAEVFMMFPMAYILVLGEIDISVGAIVCLSATLSCMVCNTNAPDSYAEGNHWHIRNPWNQKQTQGLSFPGNHCHGQAGEQNLSHNQDPPQ